ncbi:MAG: 3-coathanger stack domain-containing protein [Bacteroidota bacterium]
MKFFVISVSLLLLTPFILRSQSGGINFFETVKRTNEYYDQAGKKAPGYKQFKRWEWYYKTRVGLDGRLVDNSQYKQDALVQTDYLTQTNGVNAPTANTGAWSLIGPTSVSGGKNGIGRVNRITFHPTNASTFYVSSAGGGLWRTTNSGAGWTCLTNGLPNINTIGMVIDYNNTNVLYLLTGDGESVNGGAFAQFEYAKYTTGVLKSFDGGQTWFQTGLEFAESDQMRAYKIVMHPTNANILMVATDDGVYRTTNGGNTWQLATGVATFRVWDIEFKPGAPSTVFTASQTGFYRSINDGATFQLRGSMPGSGRTAIAVCPSNPNRVWVLAGEVTDSVHFRGLYRHNDADGTHTLVNNTPNILGRSGTGVDEADQSGYDLAIAVKPDNSAYVITGGIREWITTNSGASFTFQENTDYHDDIHDLAYNPLNNKLYMCGDGGVYVSDDHGESWDDLNTGLAVSQYYEIAVSEVDANQLIGGLQDNGTNKRNTGSSGFTQTLGADGMDCSYGITASVAFASTQGGNFYRSSSSGSSFTEIINPELLDAYNINVGNNWVVPIAVHPGDHDTIFLSYTNALVKAWRGSFGWNNFARLRNWGNTFIKVGNSNARRMYNGSNEYTDDGSARNFVSRSDDGGSTWTNIISQLRSSNPPITDLAINPGNSLEIWLTYGGYTNGTKVFYSSDGGATFTNISGSLPNIPINTVVYGSAGSDGNDPVYIGTDIGVFYRENNLGDWIPYSNGLPVVEITDIEFSAADNKMRVGTYGRGIWESSLYNACQTDLNLTTANQAINMPYYQQAGNSISSTAWVYGTGAKVFYKAGTQIDLKVGFEAASYDDETVFEAAIGACGGGVPSAPNMLGQEQQGNGKSGYLVQPAGRRSSIKR